MSSNTKESSLEIAFKNKVKSLVRAIVQINLKSLFNIKKGICLAELKNQNIHSRSRFLCLSCEDQISELTPDFDCGKSIFNYDSVIRELILRAKIKGEFKAIQCILELSLDHPAMIEEMKLCEQVVPVPASFIGRLKGQIDLAYLFSSHIAAKYKKKFLTINNSDYWSFKKRSVEKNRQPLILNFPRRKSSIPTLLIDDVITSGYSLNKISKKLPKAQCRFLTLACAYSDLVN